MGCIQHEHDDEFCQSCKDRARVEELEAAAKEVLISCEGGMYRMMPADVERVLRDALAKKGGA